MLNVSDIILVIPVAVSMGGFVSKRELGLLEAGDDQSRFSSPPPVGAAPTHFMPRELDPRSPTDGIDRTPIPISAPQETVADPRSPSEGIVRTPIPCFTTESGQCCFLMHLLIC